MPKIRITCNDPCATDSSSGDDESIEEEKPKTGGVLVDEISVSVPLVIPIAISTVHLDSLANLNSDSSFRVDKSKSSRDGPNCIVLALSSRKPEETPGRKSGILSVCKRMEKSSMAKKSQVDATNLSSKEDGSIEASPTSINVAVDIPVAENSRRRGTSGHPGVHMQSSGKWGVRVRDPITRTRIWVGSYSTLEEAINMHNKKKLEYAPLRSEMVMGGNLSVQNTPEKLPMAQKCQLNVTSSSSQEDGSARVTPTSIDVTGASKYPGLQLRTSGKWGVRIRSPTKRGQIWLGTYSTIEEATDVYNKNKLECVSLRSKMAMQGNVSVQNTPGKLSMAHKCQLDVTSSLSQEGGSAKVTPTSIDVAGASKHPGLQLRSKMVMQDDSSRLDESKSSVGEPHCIVLGLSARQPEDTRRKKSGVFPVRNRLKKSSMAVDIPISKNSTSLGAEKHIGLRLQSSGRWGVQIQDPIKRAKIWLGTYNTVEEAKNAYDKKKLEYSSLRPAVFKHKKHSVPKAKRKQKKLVVEDTSVYETKSGKWGAWIKDPVSRVNLWLGSHDTPKEAVKSYNRKMLEFDSSYNCGSVGKSSSIVQDSAFSGKEAVNDTYIPAHDVADACIPAPDVDDTCIPASHDTPEEAVKSYDRIMLEFDSSYNCDSEGKSSSIVKEAASDTCVLALDVANACIPARDIAYSVTTNNADFERPVMKLTETDKWRVAIRHPMLKCSFSLGSYDTPEEAAEAYNKKKLELEAVLNSDKITCPRADTMRQESHPHQKETSDVTSSAAVDSNSLPVKKQTGVRLCSSGRWLAQIQGPFTKKNKVHLGTFNTAEEAAEAFNRTRREFDAIVSLVNKRKHEGDSEAHKKKMKKKHKAELLSKKTIILEEGSMADDERSRLFEIVVAPQSYTHQHKVDCVFVSKNSAVTAMSSQASNNSHEKQILRFSPAEHEIGMGVIDSFGQLIGEYSRLDDELWLSRPGDDEFDVHVAMGGDTGELAWDPDLKPSLF